MEKLVIVGFTQMCTEENVPITGAKEGMTTPQEININEIVKIDYGNYGTEHDRHAWPGWQIKGGPGTTRPVLIIYTNSGQKIVAASGIYFKRQERFSDEA